MFSAFFRFELAFWLRSIMLYVFVAVVSFLYIMVLNSDAISLGTANQSLNKNAPVLIHVLYSISWVFTLLMTTAFMTAAANRDFASKASQIVFSTPVKKWQYLAGRFSGGMIASMIPSVGITVGLLLGSLTALFAPDDWGPIYLSTHVWSWLVFLVPNTFIIGSFVFGIAVLTRSSTFPFIAAILLIVVNVISGVLTQNLDNELVSTMIDPYGTEAFSLAVRYFSPEEQNTTAIVSSTYLLLNRVVWVAAAAVFWVLVVWRFSFAERRAWLSKKTGTEADNELMMPKFAASPLVKENKKANSAGAISVLWAQFKIDLRETVGSRVFLILLSAAIFVLMVGLIFTRSEGYGISSRPLTYWVINTCQGTMSTFLVATIIFYSGVLVWKERESNLDEVYDAMPYRSWTTYTAKFLVLAAIVVFFQLVAFIVGIGFQIASGFYIPTESASAAGVTSAGLIWNEIPHFLVGMFVLALIPLIGLVVMSLFLQIVSINKYLGYFLMVGFIIVPSLITRYLDWSTELLDYGSLPNYVYSDFYGYRPFVTQLAFFSIYWIAIYLCIATASLLLWQRGRETRLLKRIGNIRTQITPSIGMFGIGSLLFAISVGGWIAYNTMVLNELAQGQKELDKQAQYERKYRQYIDTPQPTITKVRFDIDLFPESRDMKMIVKQSIRNNHEEPLSKIHFTYGDNFKNTIDVPNSTIELDDKELGYRIYDLADPMMPGESREIELVIETDYKGFEQQPRNLRIAQNGSFFTNAIVPQIRYQQSREIQNNKDREDRDLGEAHRTAKLEAECSHHCQHTYISNNSDWVTIETVISTTDTQTAIAPGKLIKKWIEKGRNYFHYRVDQPSLNFYAFMSAEYAIDREKLGDIDLEVYYHPSHNWNVDKMMSSMRDSLDYYTTNFGPYKHEQARIIEFPRWRAFAQAFPGTMPYSEAIGFVADLESDDAIDLVYYVVAHEMAHQWWAHQVVGANVQGATVLSETLAQYSALMVMEKKYGRDMMRKFLEYEMDQYLRGRGGEQFEEQPLVRVEPSQAYIHYQKGSVMLYYLKEQVGEEAINRALKKLVEQFAYKGPPYPTSLNLLAVLRDEIPFEKQYLLTDLFEKIIFYQNKSTAATYRELEDGKYEITLNFSVKKLESDSRGKTTSVEMDDFVEIGAFAAETDGQRYGRTLHREQLRIAAGDHTATFVVDEIPKRVGVDPFFLLIDRVRQDNLIKPTLE